MATTPTSPGRCLAVLLLAAGMLVIWVLYPLLLAADELLLLLVAGANVAVFFGATRPLWRGTRPTAGQDVRRALVLVPCLLFHLLTPPAGLLWLLVGGLD